MAGLYARLGDRAGRIEMLRMLAHGAGLRDGTSRAHAYLDLAEAYDDVGEPRRAAAYYRSVLHTTEERRGRRRSQAALERHEFAEGEPDDVILHDALSSDPLLQRAGRAALCAGALQRDSCRHRQARSLAALAQARPLLGVGRDCWRRRVPARARAQHVSG